MDNNIDNTSFSENPNIRNEEEQSQKEEFIIGEKRTFCIYKLLDMILPIVEKRYEKLSANIIELQKIVKKRNYSKAKIKSLFAKSITEDVFIVHNICREINKLTKKLDDNLLKISTAERRLLFSRDKNNRLPFDWVTKRGLCVENYVREFINFIQIIQSFLDSYYEVEIKDIIDYDSRLQYLTEISEEYVVLGETINYFFKKLYELNPYMTDDMLNFIHDYFLHVKTEPVIAKSGNAKAIYNFDEQTIKVIHNFYRRNEKIKAICTELNFAAMFENADFSQLKKDDGNTPTIVCLAIYCFYTYMYKGSDRKEWFRCACKSINKNENTVRTKAHNAAFKEELEFWRKIK